jgi:hypothetical protein
LKYCNKPKLPTDLSKVQYRTATKFKFSLNKYHDWFSESFELIKTHGWYSASNKNNNLNGCSRDHMYSVSDGYKNNIQANIISHPANCRIITHPENQRKREKSIISLSELLKRIEEFDKIYGGV